MEFGKGLRRKKLKTRNLYSKLSKYQTQESILRPRIEYVNSMPDDGESFMNRLSQIRWAIILIKDLIASEGVYWPPNDAEIPF